ncbi:cupin-like domain-containing protein [Tolypothrix bouteillei VB521301_2]
MNIHVENQVAQNSVNKIERIHNPTPEEFKRATLSYRQPVIVTGKIAEWKAFSLWSIDYLNKVVGNKEINVNISKNKIFTFDPETEDTFPSTKMQFTEFTDWINQEKKDEQYYYLQQQPIEISFPELFPDVEIPNYLNKNFFMIANLWIGTGGNTTPLHWDAARNLLSQVRGRKKILLFEPKQAAFLYPFPAHSKTPHMSYLNIDKPDFDKFPKFQKAKYIECLLEPGEMLFIPAFWWHHVYSLDRVNIAVNFWWQANLKDYFAPQARRILVQRPQILWAVLLQQSNWFLKIFKDFTGQIFYKKRM